MNQTEITNKIEKVESKIKELQNKQELQTEFKKEFCEALNLAYGDLYILYSFENDKIECESLTSDIIVPNSVYLDKITYEDFKNVENEELESFLDFTIECLSNISNWRIYDENREQITME